MTALTATALVCTLKQSPADSSSDLLARQILDALTTHEVKGQVLRVADYDVLPGVSADEGDGDEWPRLRAEIAASDILVVATPTWVGHMSSIAQRVLERLDAALSETDEAGRPAMTGKVAVAAVVGNEDGAHKIVADLFQGLNDIGFTIPSQGCTYWNDQAMGGTDYKDLDQVPEAVAATTATLARNAAHLARLLAERNYPAPK
ncbi:MULTISPECIES: NAD(P)H-dependent oxidoreductase [unclassified Nocardia]|uniref:flavodoxin family protein n=1 Tax=unclassified Nocardia TaxID=2637762 RepID=UPI0024A92122|nr:MULTISPECIES: NAD(P)H-dependent oxidoreductase [unclassified Nocardia]